MSVMFSGNAKPDTNVRQRNRFLADPERVKKDLEHERRITRLQQVRRNSIVYVIYLVTLRNNCV